MNYTVYLGSNRVDGKHHVLGIYFPWTDSTEKRAIQNADMVHYCGDLEQVLIINILQYIQQQTGIKRIKVYCLPELEESVICAADTFDGELQVDIVLAQGDPYTANCELCCRLAGERNLYT